MIRINLMNHLGLSVPSTTEEPKSNKSRVILYSALALALIGGGIYYTLPQIMEQFMPSAPTITEATPPAKDSLQAQDQLKMVAVEKIDEVNLDSAESVQQALDQGLISENAIYLGVSASQMNQQSLAMLRLIKQYTPSSVRYAELTMKAPNFISAHGMIDTPKDFSLWQKSLKAKTTQIEADSLVPLPGRVSYEFKMGVMALKANSKTTPNTLPKDQVVTESEKFSNQLQSSLGSKSPAKAAGSSEIGNTVLKYFDQDITQIDFDQLIRMIESIQNPAIGIAQITLKADANEGVHAVVRFAVFTEK